MVTKNRALHVVPVASAPEDLQREVYDLVHETVLRMLGPGGSFAITVRTDNSDAIFASMLAETMAWQVSVNIESSQRASARLTA